MVENLLKHIDRLMEQRPRSRQALKAYRDLVHLMGETPVQAPAVELERGLDRVKKEEGFPLYSRDEMPLDFEAGAELLCAFLDHLRHEERKDKEGLKEAYEKVRDDRAWADGLLRASVKEEVATLSKAAREVQLDQGTLDFLARAALKPSLHALRDALSHRVTRVGWEHGYCPLCGSQPDMAYLGKEGKRHLHCGFCGEEWPFPRVTCPFCENRDQETLGYFFDEKEEGFRVDFCRKCKRYIKTVDQRVFEEPAPIELETLATLHLDLLANQHGFQ
jgi:FdhE protein